MKVSLCSAILAFVIFVSSQTAVAGWQEGLNAFNQYDFATAIRELEPLAVQGNVDAQIKLGELYDISEDFQRALYWFEKAAKQGSAVAQMNLGLHYQSGKGVPTDSRAASVWFGKALGKWEALAKKGNLDALLRLGAFYDTQKDYPQALLWYKKAADMGSATADLQMAFHYRVGWGVPANDKVGFYWYKKAAEKGDGYIAVANSYRDGEGVKKDYKQAEYWYKKEAERGSVTAYYLLGVIYGKKYLADHMKAVHWFKKAFEGGNGPNAYYLPSAAYYLAGEYLENGDVEHAKQWYEKTTQMNDRSFADSARAKLVEIEDAKLHR